MPYGAVRFVRDQFGAEPDPWQVDVLIAFADPKIQRISLQACVGPGKTAVMAWCGWYFLACQYLNGGEHPNGFALATTGDNLRDNLWKEFSKWQARSPLLSATFTWTATRIASVVSPQTWFIAARTWPHGSIEQQAQTLSGLHGESVAVFIDESGDIPPAVLRAGDQALSTGPMFGKLMQAGNPISLEGMLYAAAGPLRHQWHVIKVTGDPGDPNAWVHAPRVGPGPLAYAKEQIATYGRENPWVMSQILGQFPPSSINALLSIEQVEAAMARHFRIDQYDWAQKRLGVDVARYGDDRTVIFPRQGLASFMPIVLRHARDSAVSTDIANKVMACKAKWGSEVELFDATGGWAAGAVDVMRSQGLKPIDVQFASTVTNDSRYYNRRAEIWCEGTDALIAGAGLPPIPELVGELTTPTYTFKNGKKLIEPKELVKKRLGRSPDLADAYMLTYGIVDMPAAVRGSMPAVQSARDGATRDFDPYRRSART